MSLPKPPIPVKLIVSIISGNQELAGAVIERLSERFGSTDVVSDMMPFDYTDYYAAEIGTELFRRMVSFTQLIDPDELSEIKLFTNDMETHFARPDGTRQVNIDPGYISLWHLVLASCKPFAHRPYLGKGVYADLTLLYRGKTFTPLAWTFPDYRSQPMIALLNDVRERYYQQVKKVLRAQRFLRNTQH
ncbi:MAG: DUF4416 family protein [Desulfobacterota bacterium]|nr:DUF4416 family protein [Thermodesulfobacteriota bacterium]